MKHKQLSHKEAQFRNRFIAEHNYNKSEQRLFDEEVKNGDLSYSFIYKSVRKGVTFSFMNEIALRRVSRAVAKLTIESMTVAKIFPDFLEYLKEREI